MIQELPILIYEALDDPLNVFKDPWIANYMQMEFKVNPPFCVDSFSDGLQIGLALKLLKSPGEKLLVVLFDSSTQVKGLNSLIKGIDQSTSVLVHAPMDGPNLPLKKSVEYCSEPETLKNKVKIWIHENSKESESS